MPSFTERDVEECACLHKQVTEWILCGHVPCHLDLADAVIHILKTDEPEIRRIVRAATSGRRAHGGEHRHEVGASNKGRQGSGGLPRA
jgi:hypothetical protein